MHLPCTEPDDVKMYEEKAHQHETDIVGTTAALSNAPHIRSVK